MSWRSQISTNSCSTSPHFAKVHLKVADDVIGHVKSQTLSYSSSLVLPGTVPVSDGNKADETVWVLFGYFQVPSEAFGDLVSNQGYPG